MPPAKSPAVGQIDNDVLVMIGQLLEATKSSSESIRQLGTEVNANAQAFVSAVKTLSTVEQSVSDLTKIVRTGNGAPSLVASVAANSDRMSRIEASIASLSVQLKEMDQARIRDRLDDVETSLEELFNQMAKLDQVKTTTVSFGWAAKYVLIGLAWFITTLIAAAALVVAIRSKP